MDSNWKKFISNYNNQKSYWQVHKRDLDETEALLMLEIFKKFEGQSWTKNQGNIKKELIKEGKIIIEKLLSKKDFGSSSNYDEVLSEETFLNRLKNYFAGFLKLRKFSDNSTPRGLITMAEKELENKNFNNFFEILNLLLIFFLKKTRFDPP